WRGGAGGAGRTAAGEDLAELDDVVLEVRHEEPLDRVGDPDVPPGRMKPGPVEIRGRQALDERGRPPQPALDPVEELAGRALSIDRDPIQPIRVRGDPTDRRRGSRVRGEDGLELAGPVGEHLVHVAQDLAWAPAGSALRAVGP